MVNTFWEFQIVYCIFLSLVFRQHFLRSLNHMLHFSLLFLVKARLFILCNDVHQFSSNWPTRTVGNYLQIWAENKVEKCCATILDYINQFLAEKIICIIFCGVVEYKIACNSLVFKWYNVDILLFKMYKIDICWEKKILCSVVNFACWIYFVYWIWFICLWNFWLKLLF